MQMQTQKPADSIIATTSSTSAAAAGDDLTDSSSEEQHEPRDEAEKVDSWASITGRQYDTLFQGTAAEHVSQI